MKSLDLFSAFIYLLPGFLHIELFRKHFPAKKDKDFARILHSILFSFLFIGIAYLIEYFSLIKFSEINKTKNLFLDKKIGNIYLIIFLYSFSIIFAYIRVIWRNLRLKYKKLNFIAPKPDVLWLKIQKPGEWSVIITKDGQRYLGYISDYTYDPNSPEDIDILLKNTDCVNEDLSVKYHITGKGVYIKLSDINRIEFYKKEKKI